MKSPSPSVVIAGQSAAAERLRTSLASVVGSGQPVLLVGERGVGKSFIARWIHEQRRTEGDYVDFNCTAAAEELLRGGPESAKGAEHIRSIFQSAINRATNGTLVLEQMDELPVRSTWLLFAALAGETSGGPEPKPLLENRKLIATTTKRFEFTATLPSTEFVRRTRAAVLEVPPLRERADDIEMWADMLRKLTAAEASLRAPRFHESAIKALKIHDWPGNLLELESVVRRLTLGAASGDVTKSDVVRLLPRPAGATSAGKIPVTALRRRFDTLTRELEYLRGTAISANPIWQGREFDLEDDYCFVLMPFRDERDIQRVFRSHVKPLIERKFRLRCERADDIYGIAGVMQSVWEGINRARLVIAELTGRNPNVFYELGIAHTLGKPVVMISQTIDDVPADLRHLRCIIYDYKPEEIVRFESALEKTVASALSMTAADVRRRQRIE